MEKQGLSYDTKTIITILLLLMFYPVGIILMFVWMKWKWWIKLLVFFPITFFFLGIFVVAILATINPSAQVGKAKDATAKNNAAMMLNATERYFAKNGEYPWGNRIGYKTLNPRNETWLNKLVMSGEIDNDFIDRFQATDFSLSQNSEGVEICYESLTTNTEVCVPEK